MEQCNLAPKHNLRIEAGAEAKARDEGSRKVISRGSTIQNTRNFSARLEGVGVTRIPTRYEHDDVMLPLSAYDLLNTFPMSISCEIALQAAHWADVMLRAIPCRPVKRELMERASVSLAFFGSGVSLIPRAFPDTNDGERAILSGLIFQGLGPAACRYANPNTLQVSHGLFPHWSREASNSVASKTP